MEGVIGQGAHRLGCLRETQLRAFRIMTTITYEVSHSVWGRGGFVEAYLGLVEGVGDTPEKAREDAGNEADRLYGFGGRSLSLEVVPAAQVPPRTIRACCPSCLDRVVVEDGHFHCAYPQVPEGWEIYSGPEYDGGWTAEIRPIVEAAA